MVYLLSIQDYDDDFEDDDEEEGEESDEEQEEQEQPKTADKKVSKCNTALVCSLMYCGRPPTISITRKYLLLACLLPMADEMDRNVNMHTILANSLFSLMMVSPPGRRGAQQPRTDGGDQITRISPIFNLERRNSCKYLMLAPCTRYL